MVETNPNLNLIPTLHPTNPNQDINSNPNTNLWAFCQFSKFLVNSVVEFYDALQVSK